jgi:hypothetical protein
LEFRAGAAAVGTVICTGGVGYVGHRTFARLLQILDLSDLWFVVFVLRVFDYSPIAGLLAESGLATERWPGTYRQRRFSNAAEQAAVVSELQERGLDPAGKEADGWYHAECWVSRPSHT